MDGAGRPGCCAATVLARRQQPPAAASSCRATLTLSQLTRTRWCWLHSAGVDCSAAEEAQVGRDAPPVPMAAMFQASLTGEQAFREASEAVVVRVENM